MLDPCQGREITFPTKPVNDVLTIVVQRKPPVSQAEHAVFMGIGTGKKRSPAGAAGGIHTEVLSKENPGFG
jgi:hypothetical protein